ncbi:MAG: hypothetical protein ACUVXI_15315 [bacterium]
MTRMLIVSVLILLMIASIARADLTDGDLTKIENMILQSEKRILEQVDMKILQSEKRILEQVDVKISALEQKIEDRISGMASLLTTFLGIGFGIITALMIAIIAIPTVTGFLQGRRERKAEDRILALESEIKQIKAFIKMG